MSPSDGSSEPLLHRYINFKRSALRAVRLEPRFDQLSDDNIMTVVAKMARPMTIDEVLASEYQTNDTSFSHDVFDESMLELLGRARSFQRVFPQYKVYHHCHE